MRSNFFSAAALLAVAQLVAAQTSTDCQPLEKTCPDDTALGTTKTIDFTAGKSSEFTTLAGTTVEYNSEGIVFDITNEKQAPTIESNWYFFFGSVEVVMKASPGQGIVSSFVLESDDLDEVDWEWIGSDTKQVQSNYFGKGDDSTFDRGGFHAVANPQTEFHTYKLDWTAEKLVWSIDGAAVRTLLYADAKSGTRYPQTPMKVKIGSWVAGSSTAPTGTVEWAGGLASWTNNPTYQMVVKSVKITDANTGATSYSYGDKTGSWESIVISTDGKTDTSSSSSKASSSTAAPSSTKASSSASTKAASTSTKEESSTSTKASATSSFTTIASSSNTSTEAGSTATDSPATTTGDSTSEPSSTSTDVATGAGAKLGANLAMVGAVIAFFAL
ncbi:hypothetical protein VE03_06359 [Pseudogymnoascus sp. 23342-1-I1]|nr:hypothetical protein VE03_06359 [Pseudogymnoascus sp. 23342-1-I1]